MMLSNLASVLDFARYLEFSTSIKLEDFAPEAVADFTLALAVQAHPAHALLRDKGWKVGYFHHDNIKGWESRAGYHIVPVEVVEVPVFGKNGKQLKKKDHRIEPKGSTTVAPGMLDRLLAITTSIIKPAYNQALASFARQNGGCYRCGGHRVIDVRIMSDVWDVKQCPDCLGESSTAAHEAAKRLSPKHDCVEFKRHAWLVTTEANLRYEARIAAEAVSLVDGCEVVVDSGRKHLGERGIVAGWSSNTWGQSIRVEQEDGTVLFVPEKSLKRVGHGFDLVVMASMARLKAKWAGKTRNGAYSVNVGGVWSSLLAYGKANGLLEKCKREVDNDE